MGDVVSLCQRREHERRGRVVDALLAEADGEWWATSYLLAELRANTERHRAAAEKVRRSIATHR